MEAIQEAQFARPAFFQIIQHFGHRRAIFLFQTVDHVQPALQQRAELRPGEDEELDARKNLLRSSGKLMEAIQEAQFAAAGAPAPEAEPPSPAGR